MTRTYPSPEDTCQTRPGDPSPTPSMDATLCCPFCVMLTTMRPWNLRRQRYQLDYDKDLYSSHRFRSCPEEEYREGERMLFTGRDNWHPSAWLAALRTPAWDDVLVRYSGTETSGLAPDSKAVFDCKGVAEDVNDEHYFRTYPRVSEHYNILHIHGYHRGLELQLPPSYLSPTVQCTSASSLCLGHPGVPSPLPGEPETSSGCCSCLQGFSCLASHCNPE